MIILYTTVLSAFMRMPAEAAVMEWLNAQDPPSVWTATICTFEVRYGLERVGRSVALADTLIAGLAISRGAIVAARNVRHFADLETGVVDPWTGAGI